MSKRKIDLGMARRFLRTLAPGADKFTWQLFSDAKTNAKRSEARVIVSALKQAAPMLSGKNERGIGVFVTINETDGAGRTLANLKAVRAVWGDMDGAPTPKWPLQPSMIVESSPGKFHFYWLIDGDMPLTTWRGIMARIAGQYGADRAATDPVRVLRVPGFFHCKDKPTMVKLVQCSGRRYMVGALLKAFPPITRKPTRQVVVTPNAGNVDRAALCSALEHLAATPHPRLRQGGTYVDDYETWTRFGLAIKRDLGDDGFSIWDEWGQFSDRYPGTEASKAKWDAAFDVETRSGTEAIHVGTIFHTAKRQGWSFTKFQVNSALEKARALRKAVEVRT